MKCISGRLTGTTNNSCQRRVRLSKCSLLGSASQADCFTARALILWLRCETAKTIELKTESSEGHYLGLGLVWRINNCRPRSRLGYVYFCFKSLVLMR